MQIDSNRDMHEMSNLYFILFIIIIIMRGAGGGGGGEGGGGWVLEYLIP